MSFGGLPQARVAICAVIEFQLVFAHRREAGHEHPPEHIGLGDYI